MTLGFARDAVAGRQEPVLDSWFPQLAFSAVVVTALALVVLLRARDHTHKAAPGGAARWVRVLEAASLVALGGSGVAALLGAGPGAAGLVAVLLGGSVLGWARLRRAWRVAAVATWGSGTVAAAGSLVWLVESVVSAGSFVPALLLLALTPMVVWGVVSLREPVQAWLAGSGRPPLLALAAAAAPALAAVAVVSSVQAPPSPRAGSSDTGAVSPAVSSGPGAPGGTSSTSAPAGTPGPTTASLADAEAVTTGGTPEAAMPTPEAGSTEDVATAAPTTPDPSGTATRTAPTASPTPETTKTPGYEKDKPHRPTAAPSPGGGRPD